MDFYFKFDEYSKFLVKFDSPRQLFPDEQSHISLHLVDVLYRKSVCGPNARPAVQCSQQLTIFGQNGEGGN